MTKKRSGMAAHGRQGTRQLLLQALYQSQLSGTESADLIKQFSIEPGYKKIDADYFEALLRLVEDNCAELDAHISAFGDIAPDRVDPVERSVLWIALAEFCYQPEVPAKVILNEAVELAKSYGAEGGYRFINGLLDKASAKLRPTDN